MSRNHRCCTLLALTSLACTLLWVPAQAQSELPPPRVLLPGDRPGPTAVAAPLPPGRSGFTTLSEPLPGQSSCRRCGQGEGAVYAPALNPPDLPPPPGTIPYGSPTGKSCEKIPCGAIPAPNGYFVRQWQTAQAAKAAADNFVIYQHEWYMGGPEPGPYGRYHLNQIARRLPGVSFPVILQPDAHEEVNQMRLQLVIHYLAAHGVPDAAQRVFVDFPAAEGLYGEEAVRVFGRMFTSGNNGNLGGGLGGGFGGGSPNGGVGGSLGGYGGSQSGIR